MNPSNSNGELKKSDSLVGRVAVLGVGGTGVKIVSTLTKSDIKLWMKTGALDFDEQSISSFYGENIISSDFPPLGVGARGAGGDILVGERLTATVRTKIAEFVSGASMLVGVCGMGGGTGTAGSSIVARVAKKLCVPSIFVVTMPFSFEGHQRMQAADKGLENLLPDADVVIPIHNDILYSMMPSETSVQDAFLKADGELAIAVQSLSELAVAESYLSGTFPTFKNMLGKRKSSCAIGTCKAKEDDGKDFCHLALERLMDSPLLGGNAEVKKADVAAVMLSGGVELSIGSMKKMLERVKNIFNDNTEIICSTTVDKGTKGTIRITVLTAKYERSSLEMNASDKNESGIVEKKYTQDELPLMTQKKGIFTNASDNFFNSQDLDVPTFQRKGVIIDTGR